jgi:hypothetical protein
MGLCKITSIFHSQNEDFPAGTLGIKGPSLMYCYIALCKNTSELPIQYFFIFLEIVA